MERDRLTDDANLHVNMHEIEEHLRANRGLSASEWQAVLARSVKVEGYTRDAAAQARRFAEKDRAARRENPLAANALTTGRMTLHRMQEELDGRVQQDIDELQAAIGADAVQRIHAYLEGTGASSISRMQLPPAQVQAHRGGVQ